MQFTKKLKRQLGLDFDPNADVEVHDGLCMKFFRTYDFINDYVPVQTLSESYNRLSWKIEKLLLDNSHISVPIMELIAYCFDDADRVVTPIYFPGKKNYMD